MEDNNEQQFVKIAMDVSKLQKGDLVVLFKKGECLSPSSELFDGDVFAVERITGLNVFANSAGTSRSNTFVEHNKATKKAKLSMSTNKYFDSEGYEFVKFPYQVRLHTFSNNIT